MSTNVYSTDRKSRLEEVQYGNGGKVKYSYDEFDRLTGITHDNDTDPKFTYEYDAKGRAAVAKDTTDGSSIRNNYDQTDRPTESEQRDGNDNLKYRTLIEYDVKNRVKTFNEATDSEAHRTEYTYDKDNRPTEVKYDGSNSTKVNYTYDKLNRVTNRIVTNGTNYVTQFGYIQGAAAYGSNATTPLVQSITQGSKKLYNRKKKSTERYNDYGGGLLFLSHMGVQNAFPGVFCDVTRLKSNCSHLNFVDVNSSGAVM